MLGAAESDVHLAEVLATGLFLGKGKMLVVIGVSLFPDVELAAERVVWVVVGHRLPARAPMTRVPEVGAVNDWELEALRPVNGKHLHRGPVRVQAPAEILLTSLRDSLVRSAREPGSQRRRAELLARCLRVEELCYVAEVREAPLALLLAEEALGEPFAGAGLRE